MEALQNQMQFCQSNYLIIKIAEDKDKLVYECRIAYFSLLDRFGLYELDEDQYYDIITLEEVMEDLDRCLGVVKAPSDKSLSLSVSDHRDREGGEIADAKRFDQVCSGEKQHIISTLNELLSKYGDSVGSSF